MKKTISNHSLMLADAWRLFVAANKASAHPLTEEELPPVHKALTDAYRDWAKKQPWLASHPERYARRFASTLSAYAGTVDLAAFASTAKGRAAIGRGFRLFLEAQPELPATAIAAPLVEVAGKLEADGNAEEADLAWRQLFALGVADPRVDAAIDRLTEESLAEGIRIDIAVVGQLPQQHGLTNVSSVGAIRAFLEDRLGSRVTLPDILELLDIGQPLMMLRSVRLEQIQPSQGRPILRLVGRYANADGAPVLTNYEILIPIDEEGRPELKSRFIGIDPAFRRYGFAARSIMAMALFARRHGLQGWKDTASEMGVLTWPKLGAVPDAEDLQYAADMLGILKDGGSLPNLDLNAVDFTSIDAILALTAYEDELSSLEDFYEWARETGQLRPDEIAIFGEPYPIGYIALRGNLPGMHFDTLRTLELLLTEDFPHRIQRLEGKRDATASQAAAGLRSALRRAAMVATIATEIRRSLVPAPASFSKRFTGVVETGTAPEAHGSPDTASSASSPEESAADAAGGNAATAAPAVVMPPSTPHVVP